MLKAGREGQTMPPTPSTRRRTASCMVIAAALTAPSLAAVPARADGCGVSTKMYCNPKTSKPVTSGGGGGTGGGTGGVSGPIDPPDPVALTDNEAVDAVDGPGGNAPPAQAPPTTLQLVDEALTTKGFPVPVVHTAPNGKTYVRVRTALWVDNFDVVKTQPVSAGDQTVQATAQPVSVRWNMGEDEFTCKSAGSKDGKSCHYTYRRSSASRPGGKYLIIATITWNVTWTCEGNDCDSRGGDLGERPISSEPAPLVVSEIQTNTDQ
jgi:hypothetical protein